MVVLSLGAKVIIDLINFAVISVVAVYHSLRFHLRSDKAPKQKWFNLKSISLLIILSASISALISSLVYVPAYYSPNPYLNDGSCVYVIITYLSIGGVYKFGVHLFVVLRCSISQIQSKSVWYKIGLLMVFTDALFILYPLTGIPEIRTEYAKGGCVPIFIDPSVHLWFAASDFIIGIYCLIVFIVPLRKYIELEEAQRGIDGVNSLSSIAKKVMVWSSVMLITTMIAIIIVVVYPPSNHYVMPLDKTLNVICVIMQFRKVDLTQISSKYVCFVSWIQCQCKDRKGFQTKEMMEKVTIDGANGSTFSLASVTTTTAVAGSTTAAVSEQSKTTSTQQIPPSIPIRKTTSLSLKKEPSLDLTLVSAADPMPKGNMVLV